MHPSILAFYSNGRQAGKDTAARFAQQWAKDKGITTKRVAFADAGKELAAKALGIEAADEEVIAQMDAFKLGGQITVELGGIGIGNNGTGEIDGREFLINLMEGVREMFGQNTWINHVLPEREPGFVSVADLVLITDLRFMPEVIAVGRRGGKIVEITNPRAEAPGGRSEGEITDGYIDYRIDNSGDLEAFEIAVRSFLDSL